MGEVDPAFIQEPEHRPRISYIEGKGVPLIDLAPILSSNNVSAIEFEGLVKEVGNACKDWGFFQVINHGVPLEKRQKIDGASRKFFAQSLEEKRKVRRNEKEVTGYFDAEHTKNVRDWKEVFDFTIEEPTIVPASHEPDDKEVTEWYNQWPEYPPELRETCQEYGQEMRKTDGEWVRVKPTPGAYIINVGDIIQVWSNDRYESVEHRVMVNSERERFSLPFFFNPAHYTMVKPLEELTDEQNPAKYRAYNWGKFITTKKRILLLLPSVVTATLSFYFNRSIGFVTSKPDKY
ncbi:hypothetical protein CMV_003066 [Castanea mollissima]|uniref:Fe2OG dioxygenase domain-containing protein n=1 Tax=Castanea mollissima TaxID=60419 RepID=A0A8J4VVJ2_9ROSI|nr:hypothetical protein CMV_003066 [Castanea mollissima]